MPNPIVHWEIVSPERGVQLQEFYRNLFGWTIDADNPFNCGMVDTQSGLGINGAVGPGEGPQRVTLFAQVDDLQAYLDKAERLGGTVMMPVTEISGVVTMALFSDPDGNVFGLRQGGA
jgi:predicted enzyme related to lactoylglutathione lyase